MSRISEDRGSKIEDRGSRDPRLKFRPAASLFCSILDPRFSILDLLRSSILVLLLSLGGLLFFHRLGDRELHSSHEARAAQNAQTLLDTGDWGLPRLFDRRVEMQKPPLYYWLVAALARLTGGRVDAWAVRLPAALSALGLVVLLYLFAAGRGRPLAGLVAAAALATSLHFTWMARVGRIDMPLTFTVSLALTAFYQGRCRLREGGSGWRWFLVAYLAVGVGLLLKGPIAAVLPGVAAGACLLTGRRASPFDSASGGRQPPEESRPQGADAPRSPGLLRRLWQAVHGLGLWWGVPLTLAVALPWYLWANARTDGELFRVFFWHHNIDRGFGGEGGLAAHPWWFYGPRLLADLLPWSLLLPAAAWTLCRRGRRDDEAAFAAAWLLAVLLLLSCVRFKRADYLLPAYPGAALLLGCAAEAWLRKGRAVAVGLAVVVAGCAAGWFAYLERVAPGLDAGRPDRRFAEAVRRHTTGHVLFFRAEAHAVAFHVGRPLHTLLEWENLDVWAGKTRPTYVIMPADCVPQWPRHLNSGRLVEVLRTTDLTRNRHERPLVLLSTEARRERLPLPSVAGAGEKLAKRN
jgi:4-amino-4-deoxy-L-arabinose transferase-like glycosyltransferase